jgi:hypothetical protein
MAPERATVGIEIGKDGKLEIAELKLVCNAEPSEETRLEVWEWFRRQN